MPSAARKLEREPSHGTGPHPDPALLDAAHDGMRRPDDAAIAPLTTRRPAAHADPRLVHGGVAQGVRLLRRLQRTQGNAAVVRTLAARRRTASSAATATVTTAAGTRPAMFGAPARILVRRVLAQLARNLRTDRV